MKNNNLTPLDVTPLTGEELGLVEGKLAAVLAGSNIHNFTVRLAHVYDRKGFDAYDRVASQRNAAYGSLDDDFIIQVSLRVGGFEHEDYTVLSDITANLTSLETARARQAKELTAARLRVELAAVEAELAGLG